MTSRTDRAGGSNAGAFVILAPVLLLFIFGAIQVGLWYHARQTVTAAAQAAAEAESVALPAAGAGTSAVSQITSQGGVEGVSTTISATTDAVTVTVTGSVSQIIPLGLRPVSATITLPKEHMS